MKNTKTSQGFTLLEILVVVTLIIILVGAGVPTLFEAGKIFRFKKDMATIANFFDNARSAAINNRAIEEGADLGVDTNFDGIPPTPNPNITTNPGDTVPFLYVFEITRDSSDDILLRLYADYSNDQEYGVNDIIVEEETIAGGAYEWDFQGELYPLDGSSTIFEPDPDFSYNFAFAPPFGELTIWDESTSAPRYYGAILVFIFSDKLNRETVFAALQNTGAIMYNEESGLEP